MGRQRGEVRSIIGYMGKERKIMEDKKKKKEDDGLITQNEEDSQWRVNWKNQDNRIVQCVVFTIVMLIICIVYGWFF